MNNKEFNILAITSVIVSVLCLTVAFAALSTTLRINGVSTFSTSSWNIELLTPNSFNTSTNGYFLDNPVGGSIEGEPKVISNVVYFSSILEDKSDYVEFVIPIKNSGTIDAILSNINTSLVGDYKDLLIISVKDELNNDITNGSLEINEGETKNIKVRATYDPSTLDSEKPNTDSDVSIEIAFTFVQK